MTTPRRRWNPDSKTAYTRGQKAVLGIGYEDAGIIDRRLGHIEESIAQGKRTSRMKKTIWILLTIVATLIAAVVFLGADDYVVRQERNELRRVEWLYRDMRSGLKGKFPEWLNALEKQMLCGTDEQRDSLKREIFNREASGPQFLYFKPHDRWTPPPPKKKEQPEKRMIPATGTTACSDAPKTRKPPRRQSAIIHISPKAQSLDGKSIERLYFIHAERCFFMILGVLLRFDAV